MDDYIDWLNPGSKCCRLYTTGPNNGTFCPANESKCLCINYQLTFKALFFVMHMVQCNIFRELNINFIYTFFLLFLTAGIFTCAKKCMKTPADGVLRPSVEEFYRFLPDFLSNRPDLQCPKG